MSKSKTPTAAWWLDPELCAKASREEVEHICGHKMDTSVPREVFLRETERAPIKTGWAETDKGQPGKPILRARWVAREYRTHARPELYASTPPLEALKVVLPEIATGMLGGKVVALVDVRRAYFNAPARRKVFVELPPEDNQPGDEHMCGLLQCSLHGTRDAAQNREEELPSTLSDLQIDERECVLVRVARLHQGRTHCGTGARRQHHNRRRTIGGGTPHQNDIENVRDQEASDWEETQTLKRAEQC